MAAPASTSRQRLPDRRTPAGTRRSGRTSLAWTASPPRWPGRTGRPLPKLPSETAAQRCRNCRTSRIRAMERVATYARSPSRTACSRVRIKLRQPFVLPGESLSKYGGAPAGETNARAGCASPSKLHFQAFHADRSAPRLGWQRLVAGRIDFAASRSPRPSPTLGAHAEEASAGTEETRHRRRPRLVFRSGNGVRAAKTTLEISRKPVRRRIH